MDDFLERTQMPQDPGPPSSSPEGPPVASEASPRRHYAVGSESAIRRMVRLSMEEGLDPVTVVVGYIRRRFNGSSPTSTPESSSTRRGNWGEPGRCNSV